ncbi:hypothetical protein KKF34_02550 [Myxococcota bacterium]|nr:hypothetical protein [Myxococcota bacterium]MBU1379619.1 hypothetical protein [Myxococcota bacterium]MBU1495743.1 hypothetical protein [Myxococcota bacterium]
MKTLLIVSTLFSLFFSTNASAQQPCGTIVTGHGPIGVAVSVPCPPPPPRVVIVRRRPVRRYIDPAPAPAPVAPVDVSGLDITDVNRWTVGIMFDSTSSDKGGLAGSMVFGRFLFLENLSFELGFAGLTSCTNCNELASRKDSRVHTSVNWYWDRIKHSGFNPFLKGGFVFSNITMYNDVNGSSATTSVTAVELGGGLEWRIIPWLSLEIQATLMTNNNATDKTDDYAPINDAHTKGIPPVGANGINIRFGLNVNF